MPSYNAESYIGEAIRSILNQTYENLEIIIVDDSSDDATWNVISRIEDKRCRVYKNEVNRGIAYTRNKALGMARGKYIAFMDDDDVAINHRLEMEVEFLENNMMFGVVGGKVQFCDDRLKPQRYIKEIWCNPSLINVAYLFQSVMNNSTVMLRKSLVEEHNLLFRCGCMGMEDFDYYMRCSKVTRLTNLDYVFLKYRTHSKSETQRVRSYEFEKRKKKYAEIQRLSFSMSGFEFTDEEWNIAAPLLEENLRKYTKVEINNLIIILKLIYEKAKKIKFHHIKELEYYLRWRLGKSLERTDYWLKSM